MSDVGGGAEHVAMGLIRGGDSAVLARMWERILPEPNSGCWLWAGAVDAGGYGLITVGGKGRRAHRVAYEALRAPIPEGLVIDHLCRVRCCVNPDHLEAVTNWVNTLRSESPIKYNKMATHCRAGHPLKGRNLKVLRKGHRRCVKCHREWLAAHYAARRCGRPGPEDPKAPRRADGTFAPGHTGNPGGKPKPGRAPKRATQPKRRECGPVPLPGGGWRWCVLHERPRHAAHLFVDGVTGPGQITDEHRARLVAELKKGARQ